MNMIICLDRQPDSHLEMASIECKGCGFTFYTAKESVTAVIRNNGGDLTCPSCRAPFRTTEIRLQGPVRTRNKISPASHPPTLVTDEPPVESFKEKMKKQDTPVDGGIRFAPARTRIVINDDHDITLIGEETGESFV